MYFSHIFYEYWKLGYPYVLVVGVQLRAMVQGLTQAFGSQDPCVHVRSFSKKESYSFGDI